MASQTQGIQQLLAAEKRAAEKVADARKREFCPAPVVAIVNFRSGVSVFCSFGVFVDRLNVDFRFG